MRERLDLTLSRAVAAGVLPAGATLPGDAGRPWPVVLLTALGAWLAALPLLGVVGLLLGDVISRGWGTYIVGALVLVGAVVVLRAREVPLFIEQLAVPALLVGGGSLAFGLFRDLPDGPAALLLAALALAVALAVDRPWLRGLLGATAAVAVGYALAGPRAFSFGRHGIDRAGWANHGLLVVWVLALVTQRGLLESGARALWAAALEMVAAGWVLVVLAGMAWLAGMSFLVGGALGGGLVGEVAREVAVNRSPAGLGGLALPLCSALLAAGALARVLWAWRSLRRPAVAVPAAVLVGLAWLMPTLGATLLVLALTASTQRWRLASAAALAAAWIVGAWYYAQAWPLSTKAVVMVGAGAVLGALAWWWARREPALPVAASEPRASARPNAWVALATVLTLGVASVAIWQKQALIATGQPVFVELAPVDPRSLMQGDYMQLAYRLPEAVAKLAPPGVLPKRPTVVAQRDARGLATLLRTATDGVPLAPGEVLIELTPKNGGWTVVSDAWFFKEGEGERWAAAKYGEFRVAPDGRALLVGLADADLKPIVP